MTTVEEPGDLLYEFTAHVTEVTDFGMSLQDVLAGKQAIPPAGLRIDIAFEGELRGRLEGHAKGVDYIYLRPDGRAELDVKGTVTTPDGARVALAAGGIAVPKPGSPASVLREHAKLTTASPEYLWLNGLEVWGMGEIDVAKGELAVRAYLA